VVDSLRERKKSQTREALRRAALDLAAEKGLQSASIDDICGRAGVSSRTFFNYFPSKVSAVLGLVDVEVPLTAQLRVDYLASPREAMLLRDTCRLFAAIVENQSLAGSREKRLEIARDTPELLNAGLRALLDGSDEVRQLIAQRLAGDWQEPTDADIESARLLMTLIVAAMSVVVRNPCGLPATADLGEETYLMARKLQDVAR
jgi:AcrR family transcriptional regulator